MTAFLLVLCLLLPSIAAAQAPIDAATNDPCWNNATDTPCATWMERAIDASLIALAAAHGADLSATSYGIGAGKIREGNLLLAGFVSPTHPGYLGAAKMTIAGLQLWQLNGLKKKHPKLTLGIALADTVLYTVVAMHNVRLIREAR